MPVISSAALLNTLTSINSSTTTTTAVSPSATLTAFNITSNATKSALQVVCAWPVSGQYGPGSRVLYYVLITACVVARKAEWLRNACLAAALLFPAVAAIHSIVLAVMHVDGAVDMDVYGAFQLCSIGILAAPVTVKLSTTYFYDPGRNTIFLWTALILAGLLSLTVEFFRINTISCTHDDEGRPVSVYANSFSYNTTCGLTCSIDKGPSSPLRRGSANNIYVIPAPDRLSFDTVTLLAAACTIPAILSLVSMWNKILEINWKARFGNEDEKGDELIEGTNGATVQKMKGVNKLIRLFLSAVEIPLFGAAVLAILILGERNFFSHQVNYQTEPIASIGQWAPIVGTVLAVLGSLYILLAKHSKPEGPKPGVGLGIGLFAESSHSIAITDAPSGHEGFTNGRDILSVKIERMVSQQSQAIAGIQQPKRSWTENINSGAGKRREVAKALTAIGTYLGTPSSDRYDYTEFRRGEAQDFPEIPGEEYRNQKLRQTRQQYNQYRNEDGDVTPNLQRQTSRAGSYAGSVISTHGRTSNSPTPRDLSPNPLPTSPRRSRSVALPEGRNSSEHPDPPASARLRRDTLMVPTSPHHSATRNNPPAPIITSIVASPEGSNSPSIVVSSDINMPSPAHQSPWP